MIFDVFKLLVYKFFCNITDIESNIKTQEKYRKYSYKITDKILGYNSLKKKFFVLIPEIRSLMLIKDVSLQNEDCARVYEFLKNKKVAVVGNAGVELGKSRGAEIDSHDVVIRFNNYPEEEKFAIDYGTKCNIWVRGVGHKNEIKEKDLNKLDFVFITFDFLRHLSRAYIWDWILNVCKNSPSKIHMIPAIYREKAIEEYNIQKPTTGLLIILMLIDVCGIENVDVYGFSFMQDEGKEDNTHFYDKLCNIQGHSIDDERQVLRAIFGIK